MSLCSHLQLNSDLTKSIIIDSDGQKYVIKEFGSVKKFVILNIKHPRRVLELLSQRFLRATAL